MLLVKLKHRVNNIVRYFFLLLFLGYYTSITLFTHPHVIDGITIVHSHPFKAGTGKNPVNHQHSTNGFLLIHLLANLLTTALLFEFASELYHSVSGKLNFKKRTGNFVYPAFLFSYSLRAPPLKYTC